MKYIEEKRRKDIIQELQMLIKEKGTAKDKKQLDDIVDLYIGNNISEEVILEYLTKNLSHPEILDILEFKSAIPESKLLAGDMPLISVIIPTHGESLYIGEAVDSVLRQTYKNTEIIIMDDAGNPVKKDFLLHKYKMNKKIKYYQSKCGKRTGPEKRKTGFQKACGKYIIFLDHDDFYLDSLFFERAITFFEKMGTNNRKNKELFSCYASNALKYFEDSNSYEVKKLNVSGPYSGEEYLSGIRLKYNKPLSLFTAVFVKEKIKDYSRLFLFEDSCIYVSMS